MIDDLWLTAFGLFAPPVLGKGAEVVRKWMREATPGEATVADELLVLIKRAFYQAILNICSEVISGNLKQSEYSALEREMTRLHEQIRGIGKSNLALVDKSELVRILGSHGNADGSQSELERRIIEQALTDRMHLLPAFQEKVRSSLCSRVHKLLEIELEAHPEVRDGFQFQMIVGIRKEIDNLNRHHLAMAYDMADIIDASRRALRGDLDREHTAAYHALQQDVDAQSRFFVETQISGDGCVNLDFKQFLNHLVERRPKAHALLLGPGGIGKTTLLVRLWEHGVEHREQRLPIIYVALRDCVNGLFKYMWNRYGLSRDRLLAQYGGNWSPIVLLDGANEIGTKRARIESTINDDIVELLNSSCLCVLSSRSPDIISAGERQSYTLSMDKNQVGEFFVHYRDCIPRDFRPDDGMCDVLNTPMMLSLFLRTYPTDGFQRQELIEANFHSFDELLLPGEVYWNYYRAQYLLLQQLYRGDDDTRVAMQCILEGVLPELAFTASSEYKYSCTPDSLLRVLRNHGVTIRGRKVDWRQARRLLATTLGLMTEDKNHNLSFEHDNLRDFFAAVHLRNKYQTMITRPGTAQYEINDPPDQVIDFLCNILDPEDLMRAYEDATDERSRGAAAAALGELFLLRALNIIEPIGYPLPNESRCTVGNDNAVALLDSAREWYERGAGWGNAMAHWGFGMVCRKQLKMMTGLAGEEIRKDCERLAGEHTEQACRLGLPQGYNQMGVLYEEEIGVQKDMKQAIEYYTMGMKAGVAYSFNRLVRIYEWQAIECAANGQVAEAREHYVKAFQLAYLQATAIHEPWGMNRVACYYYEGTPIYKDRRKDICVAAQSVLGRFGATYINRLPKEDRRFEVLRQNAKREVRRLFEHAVMRGQKDAVERRNDPSRWPPKEEDNDLPSVSRYAR